MGQKTGLFFTLQKTILVLFLVAALISSSSGNAQAKSKGPELFSDAGIVKSAGVAPNPASVSRSRMVTFNAGVMLDNNGEALDAASLPQITFNLFPDATFTGQVQNVTKGQTKIWTGTLLDVNNGFFHVVAVDGVYIAHISSPSGVYEVSSAGKGLYKVIQIDQSKFIDDYPAELPVGQPVTRNVSMLGATDSGKIIDVLVVYTGAALSGENPASAIEATKALKARIALAISETNTAYASSGVTTRLRLVHTAEVFYSESGNIQTDRDRLANPADGYLDVVHTMRNQYGADMVSLITEDGGGWCGMAKAIMATEDTAFQVTARICATGNYSLGHEFAHLQGARHDIYADATNTPYNNGHGYVHPYSAVLTNHWRTIMAYNDQCSASFGYDCTRIQAFSNPNKKHNSGATGVKGKSEVYKVLNTTAKTVANFRTHIISDNFVSTFNKNAAGWYNVYGKFYYKAGNLNSTGTPGYFSSAKYAGTYGDLTYLVRMKRVGNDSSFANYITIRGAPTSGLNNLKQWNSSYMFGYTNSGYVVVLMIDPSGNASYLKGWTASTAIKPGDYNTLVVVAVGPALRYYINDTLVYDGSDASFVTGEAGVSFYRGASSTGDVLFVDVAMLTNSPTADVGTTTTDTQGAVVKGDVTGVTVP